MVGWIMGLAETWDPRSQLTENDISPFFWPNGFDAELQGVRRPGGGRIRQPAAARRSGRGSPVLLPDRAQAMPKQEQITTHFCIRAGPASLKPGRHSHARYLDLVKPVPEARYVVFYSLADGTMAVATTSVHKIENMRHELTILAYEMNGAPVTVLHRRRCDCDGKNELGFKMVKWIAAIGFVTTSPTSALARAACAGDHEFYGYRMPI